MIAGSTVNGYEVWGQLSQGGMSDVWLARHTGLRIPVILKTLRPAHAESFDLRYERLLREARLTARLTSPRVVRVVDVGVFTPPGTDAESLPFLVEEYVDGIDLAEFDGRRRNALKRPLPLWAVAGQAAQAAEGLHAAHQAGVIHCDVKPSNLFGYGHGHIKVGDFGVALAAASTEGAAPAGTPLYMAPEQLLGERIDRRADVYALGATLFALRYGRPPYANPVEGIRPDASPRFPSARTPEEAYFQHVVARMMARRVESRYPSLMEPRHHLSVLARSTAPRSGPMRLEPHVFEVGPARVVFEVGDLACAETDGIVNSAYSAMAMDQGVGLALKRAGGGSIESEAMAGGDRALGECVTTGPGRLACRGVLHAVGGWNEVSCVARAMYRVLLQAEEQGYARIAMPALATGRGQVSVEACADAMVGALRLHFALGGSRLREVRFVLYDTATYARFLEVATALLLGSEEAFHFSDEGDAPASAADATVAPTMFAMPAPSEAVRRTVTEPIRDDDPTAR